MKNYIIFLIFILLIPIVHAPSMLDTFTTLANPQQTQPIPIIAEPVYKYPLIFEVYCIGEIKAKVTNRFNFTPGLKLLNCNFNGTMYLCPCRIYNTTQIIGNLTNEDFTLYDITYDYYFNESLSSFRQEVLLNKFYNSLPEESFKFPELKDGSTLIIIGLILFILIIGIIIFAIITMLGSKDSQDDELPINKKYDDEDEEDESLKGLFNIFKKKQNKKQELKVSKSEIQENKISKSEEDEQKNLLSEQEELNNILDDINDNA